MCTFFAAWKRFPIFKIIVWNRFASSSLFVWNRYSLKNLAAHAHTSGSTPRHYPATNNNYNTRHACVRFPFLNVDLGITVVSVLQNTRGSEHWGRRGAHLSENKGMKSECKKFGENSRETASVSTICDEYCSPSQVSLHDSKHGEHTYRTKSSDPWCLEYRKNHLQLYISVLTGSWTKICKRSRSSIPRSSA